MKKNFKELIYSKDYSIYSFAKACGIHTQTVRDLTVGRRPVVNTSLLNAYKMAQVLKIPLEDLVTKYE